MQPWIKDQAVIVEDRDSSELQAGARIVLAPETSIKISRPEMGVGFVIKPQEGTTVAIGVMNGEQPIRGLILATPAENSIYEPNPAGPRSIQLTTGLDITFSSEPYGAARLSIKNTSTGQVEVAAIEPMKFAERLTNLAPSTSPQRIPYHGNSA